MTELCELKGDENVLEIGCGSGYQSAVLSPLAGRITSIERIKPLAERAIEILKALKCNNVTVIHSDGFKGYADNAPYDVIMLTAAPGQIPETLIEQLSEGGRLIAPVGDTVQQLILLKKSRGEITRETITYVSFVPMLEGCN
jgi:protein-L-isoaspartate(D-aspartate) O-methyltransferase